MKFNWTIFLFLTIAFNLEADDLFIPKTKKVFDYMPPYQSELIEDSRKKLENEEMGNIEEIVSKVVKSNDKELEKTAEELVKDKGKLERFLSSLSLKKDVCKEEVEEKFLPTTYELQRILDEFYQTPELLQKKISLKLKDADIREAIELIGKTVGYDFIVESNVKGNINNIFLKDVPVSAALKIILSSNRPRLALINDLGIWRILRLSDAVDVLTKRAEEIRKKDFVADFLTITDAKFTESFKLRVEKMWEGVVNNKKDKDGYYLVFDDSSRKIFFRGIRSEVELFSSFLREINQKIPQVKIDTRIVIASKDFEESLGLQVSGVYNRQNSVGRGWNYIGYGPVTTGGKGDIPPTDLKDWALNLLPSNVSQFLNLPLIFGGRDLNNRRLNLVLNAAENRNEIKTILKPTLLVNSEELAEILVGEQVPIETVVQERIEGTLRDINTINYKDLGMKLKVRPIVSTDMKSVFLDIYVEHSYVKDGMAAASFDAKKSIIVTTKSKNRVLLKSGQTTMIGGLISEDRRKTKQGIPFLQDIPLLGYLFKGSKRTKSDDQLMIFISPTVV